MARRRRPESTAHEIAAEHRPRMAAVRRRIPDPGLGTIVGTYLMPEHNGHRETITAAAEVMMSKTVVKQRKGIQQSWQNESWQLRDEIGEFRFSGDRIARSVSRMRLYIGQATKDGADPVEMTDGPVYELGHDMFAQIGAVQQFLKRGGQQLGFTGESYLVVSETPDGYGLDAYSTSELNPAGGTWRLNDGAVSRDLDPAREIVIRCWTPHPQWGALADCSARAVLPVARELKGLTQRLGAEIDSRLAGNGLLLVSDDIEVLRGQVGDDSDVDIDFVDALLEMMITPIKDRDSAAAIVPLVAKVSAEAVDKAMKWITFASALDPKAQEYREEAIRRLALGMDSPPETLLGLGSGSNHWSAWAISEEDVAIAVSPVAATLCHSLTTGWLRPALEQLGVPDAGSYMVWFDGAKLELRSDRSKDAAALYDKDVVSDEALRRETGFGDEDAPTDDELQQRRLWKLVMAQPNLAPVILPTLGITGLDWSKAISSTPPTPPDTLDDTEPADDPGNRELPDQPTSDAAPDDGDGAPMDQL